MNWSNTQPSQYLRALAAGMAMLLAAVRVADGADPSDWKARGEVGDLGEIVVERDVAFLPTGRKEKADLYFPRQDATRANSAKMSAVLLMHGGGFNDGDKARDREVQMAIELARHGYLCMSINYKLWNSGIKKPTWPQSLYDAKTAVRWLRAHADRLHVDPERIAAFGNSAGGNLAMMLALTSPEDGLEPEEPLPGVSTRVACGIDFYGAVDLPNYHDMKMFQCTRVEDPAIYRRASPLTYINKGDAPVLIVHGTADETVPVSQAETLAAALEKAGAEYTCEIVLGAPHTFYLVSPQRDFRPLVFEFLDKHLELRTPPPASKK